MTSEIGSRAQIPNPALHALSGVVGEWRSTAIHPMVPDTILHGRSSFAWQDNGAFLVWRSQIDGDRRFPNGIAIFGSDDAAGTVFVSYFDERGISRKYDVELTSSGFTMHRTDPKLSQRMTFTLATDGRTMVCKGEMSQNGGPWAPDLSLSYERL